MEQVLSESNLVISIDAMGGDNSPKVVIEGLALAHKRNPDIRAVLLEQNGLYRADSRFFLVFCGGKRCKIMRPDQILCRCFHRIYI